MMAVILTIDGLINDITYRKLIIFPYREVSYITLT